MGQFKDALADLLSWLTDTEGTLTSAKARPIGSDIKAIMVEIEKAEVSDMKFAEHAVCPVSYCPWILLLICLPANSPTHHPDCILLFRCTCSDVLSV